MIINSVDLVQYYQSQINKIRSNPKQYIRFLQQREFINNLQYKHSIIPNLHYKTIQGQSAVSSAINYLQNKVPVSQLILSQQLSQVAYQVGISMDKQHIIYDAEQYRGKLQKQVHKLGLTNIGETQMIIQYGFREDPQIVPSIIVDDGDTHRKNRNLLMNQNMKYVGISVNEHQQFDYMILILLNSHVQSQGNCSCSIF